MALGKLYQQGGMERPAIVAYKEVLKVWILHLLMGGIGSGLSIGKFVYDTHKEIMRQ